MTIFVGGDEGDDEAEDALDPELLSLGEGDSAAVGFYLRYEPKETLGRGLQSVVRRCTEKATGREYAVKIIDLTVDLHQQQEEVGVSGAEVTDIRTACMLEVDILRDVCSHKFIIGLHDVFESPTFIFLVFELCKHGELFDYLTQVVTLSEKKTRSVMRQLFEALNFIHEKSIVHRDLKPENILLDDDFNIKLTDFGFATYLENNQYLKELLGTPGYLAPEVLKCSMYDNAKGYRFEVDLWACGVIMYTLLVGCPPFWHRRQIVMLRSIMEGKFTFGPEWEDITENAKDLVSKLLVVDPEKRLSAKESLSHPFFHIKDTDSEYEFYQALCESDYYKKKQAAEVEREFHPRKQFRVGIKCVQAMIRIQRLHMLPTPMNAETIRNNPYGIKMFRKIIDGCGFRIYGHWVKRGEDQNRAALFENIHRVELRQAVDEQDVDMVDAFEWCRY